MSALHAAAAAGNHSQASSASQSHSGDWIDKLLKQNGINAKKEPFRAYYFIVMVVMRGTETNSQENNLNTFANQLKGVSNNTNAWNQFKSAYENVGADILAGDSSSTINAANSKFCDAAGKLMNQVFGKYMSSHGIPKFQSGPLSDSTVTSMFKNVQSIVTGAAAGNKSDEETLAKCFPGLGKNISGVISNLKTLKTQFTSTRGGPVSAPPSVSWRKAINGKATGVAGISLPSPDVMQPYLNAFSEGASTIDGVGGVESSKLQMAQQDFNQLQSFVKSLMTDWITQRKSFNSSMSQAGS